MNTFKFKEPFVGILVGPPLSGKSTWLRENFDASEIVIISRDQIVLDVYGSNNYSDAFNNVNQKDVDRQLIENITDASKGTKNVIIDMTHMSSKRRRYNLSHFPNHYKVAFLFPILDEVEYARRNEMRRLEENKWIPEHVIKNMISSYQPIKEEEGFNKVISI
jgi:predicted kinase